MPYYLAIGVSKQEFMESCPKELEPYLKAYKLQRNKEDILQWQLGQYMAAAVGCLFKGEYPKKPMFQIENDVENNRHRESNEDVAIYEMKIRANVLKRQGLPESPM